MATEHALTPELPGAIRTLKPADLHRFRDHLLRLDAVGRHDRFNGGTDDDFVRAYAERCFRDGATVFAYVEDGQIRGAAELHQLYPGDREEGEIAFSVEAALQHRGLGQRLFRRLLGQARRMGYLRLRVTTHPDNLAMKRLARKFNAKLRFEQGETVGLIDLTQLREPARLAPAASPDPGGASIGGWIGTPLAATAGRRARKS